jgi:hypothetical protein
VRDGTEAVRLAEHACEHTQRQNANHLDTLAAAYAEARRFADAVRTARRALELAAGGEYGDLATALRARLMLYEAGRAYHRPPHARAAGRGGNR